MDWWLPLKIVMSSYLWLILYVGDHLTGRNIEIIERERLVDHSPAVAVMYLKAGSPLPPGAYIQTPKDSKNFCRSIPTLGGDALAILRSNKWELTFPVTQVGIYVDGVAHGCNIDIAGSITMMVGKTGLYIRDNNRAP